MRKIIMITGGQRSGKSEEAERLALCLSAHPVYMATAQVLDDDFAHRVALHQQRRGPQWTSIEEPLCPSQHDLTGRVVLFDCLTLWLTNLLFKNDEEVDNKRIEQVLSEAKTEFERMVSQDATFIIVTNEIGLGGVSDSSLQRKFTDLQGWMNQYVAQLADEVILMVSGIAVKIK
ncbi:MAG: bifunctional adenosylcobinamide kinase/adenosylcobinamide-phosphate guanylyltransferase [Prevotella sp.]|nr:bifunctional adenosylcobinamide kinase/adenosylcobinamide-phosphate guanylyltransferase [Prevotella sp.]